MSLWSNILVNGDYWKHFPGWSSGVVKKRIAQFIINRFVLSSHGGQVVLCVDLVKVGEGSQMLFYVWFEFTSWLRGVGQGKGAWDCFLTIWAWDNCAFCQWDQWLLRDWTFILQMTLSWPDVDSLGLLPSALMFCLNLKKVPPPIPKFSTDAAVTRIELLTWIQIEISSSNNDLLSVQPKVGECHSIQKNL